LPTKKKVSLNTALLKGLYQHTKSKVADKPVEIMYFSTGSSSAYGAAKELVIVGENSHVQIIERHQSLNENPVN
jgi:Fe-S cluster assembly protein SufD